MVVKIKMVRKKLSKSYLTIYNSSTLLWSAICALLSISYTASAQNADTSNKTTVYLTADINIFTKTDSGEISKFIGNAMFRQGTDTLYCDSVYQNRTTKIMEAFGNVRIAQQGGTEATSNYLKYNSATKTAIMQGDVTLTDGKNRLWCEDLSYNLTDKIGIYNNNGTLVADSTTVWSDRGEYNVKSHNARFTGNVVVTDPHYHTRSEDMGYNTETKLTAFYARSFVVGDSGKTVLNTSSGYMDNTSGLAYFDSHTSIWYDGQYIEADTLSYTRSTGLGYAIGNVIAIDTPHHSALYCGKAKYNRRKRTLLAIEKPVMQQVNNNDTLYIAADTFYSAPMLKDSLTGKYYAPLAFKQVTKKASNDSAASTKRKREKKKETAITTLAATADTTDADSTLPLYFTGYHHVKIFSDSMQGLCDSIVYTQYDSTIRMIYSPVLWSRNSQITGDTICMVLDSSKIKKIYVPNNAFVASIAGPEKAEIYDQVQGRTLHGYFNNNEIEQLRVYPDAEAIYYTKDDSGAYIGVSQAKSDTMQIAFKKQKIQRIMLLQDITETLTPMDKADLPNTRLSRFIWRVAERPRKKEELFD